MVASLFMVIGSMDADRDDALDAIYCTINGKPSRSIKVKWLCPLPKPTSD